MSDISIQIRPVPQAIYKLPKPWIFKIIIEKQTLVPGQWGTLKRENMEIGTPIQALPPPKKMTVMCGLCPSPFLPHHPMLTTRTNDRLSKLVHVQLEVTFRVQMAPKHIGLGETFVNPSLTTYSLLWKPTVFYWSWHLVSKINRI